MLVGLFDDCIYVNQAADEGNDDGALIPGHASSDDGDNNCVR